MAWKQATKMSERKAMVERAAGGLYTIGELAAAYGVSRPTVYRWLERFDAEGEGGLADRPPIPKTVPHRTREEIEQRLVEAKQAKPHWGPRKLIAWLEQRDAQTEWPAVSTAGAILARHGLVRRRPRRRPRLGMVRDGSLPSAESGQMMTADHKGEFRLGNGQYCYPVTINDPVSRYSYAIAAVASTSIEHARPVFARVFHEYGLPRWILTDNGGPFCCRNALGELTRMVVWWLKLGITPVRIHSGCPWENGRHERMHKTLKAEATRPPGFTLRGQQHQFDRFREEYNRERPHESLGGQTPISVLRPCARPYPHRLPSVDYPGHFDVRRVRSDGSIRWRCDALYITEALAGEPVGLEEIADGLWSIQFSTIELARWDARTGQLG
jgi:putative transposase